MLKIRLQRVGRIHEPTFRLVLTDSKNSSKSGRFKEILGSYDPRKKIDSINAERAKHWLSLGASATPTVHNLLVKHKVIDSGKINLKVPFNKSTPTDTVGAEVTTGPAPVQVTEEVKEEATEEVKPE